ncbi:MAG: glycosyltransferase family 2 protein [Candidatus Omnitrophica bacterium]|nr:glycosyltransferase family 2 protein [Candidatus Omnitrophota bacterium]
MDSFKFSVCIATYNMGSLIGRTLDDVLAQSYNNYEIIVSDNASTDETQKIVESYNDSRIRYFKNQNNVGYAANLNLCVGHAKGDIIFLMSAKSRISQDALEETCRAFSLSEDVGAVTRPYYWYGEDLGQVVRAKDRFAEKSDLLVSVHDDPRHIIEVFKTVDNPGGLAYKKEFMDMPFHSDPFVEFIYPFASILKKHKVVLLKNYTMACPALEYSGSQNPLVYKKSPMQCWVDMFDTVFGGTEFKSLKEHCIKDFVATNYVGLAQVRNYGGFRCLLREISQLIKYRKANLLCIKFWVYSIGSIVIPPCLLKGLVKFFKKSINTKLLNNIRLGA